VNTIDPTDSRSLDQAIMMGMPGLENPCVERIANTPDGVQPCYGCTLDCPYCTADPKQVDAESGYVR